MNMSYRAYAVYTCFRQQVRGEYRQCGGEFMTVLPSTEFAPVRKTPVEKNGPAFAWAERRE